ncbi:MAG: hypothetical protein IH851_11225 [Armatimonadetes bacterium]|nr:hypothetical protein [Armatimonadota bacterium]
MILKDLSRLPRLAALDGSDIDLEACPACGTTRDQVAETGFVGCPACYAAFRPTVRRLREPPETESRRMKTADRPEAPEGRE